MRTYQEYETILNLWEQTKNKKRIALLTGIPRGTVMDCISRYGNLAGLLQYREAHPDLPKNLIALQAGDDSNQSELFRAYSYLFGIYLGDGCISRLGRSYTLRIACDAHYPNLITSFIEAIRIVNTKNTISTVNQKETCIIICCYSNFWPDMFPQHGSGNKHLRPIQLTEWQADIVHKYPHEFIKGLLQTDGSRTTNIVKGTNYPRYEFCNFSADIKKLFSDTCDQLGLHWRSASQGRVIQVARRADVAYLDQFIGPKS